MIAVWAIIRSVLIRRSEIVLRVRHEYIVVETRGRGASPFCTFALCTFRNPFRNPYKLEYLLQNNLQSLLNCIMDKRYHPYDNSPNDEDGDNIKSHRV